MIYFPIATGTLVGGGGGAIVVIFSRLGVQLLSYTPGYGHVSGTIPQWL